MLFVIMTILMFQLKRIALMIMELRMIIPDRAMIPRIAIKPNGVLVIFSANTTPMRPSGAVSKANYHEGDTLQLEHENCHDYKEHNWHWF